MLTKQKPARERLLLMGGWGSGKSRSWCTVAQWLRRTKSQGRMFVIDTDHTAERQAEGYDDFDENIIVADCWDFKECLAAAKRYRLQSEADREDWLVVDLANKVWDWTSDYFIGETYGKNAAEFYQTAKTEGQKGHALADAFGTNWQVINRHYGEFMTEVKRFPGHVMLCTGAEAVNRGSTNQPGDSKELLAIFGRLGAKPRGQKDLAHDMHTVLWMQSQGEGEKVTWKYTTAKDLHREYVMNQPMRDFVMDYLVPVAGWTLEG